MVTPVMLTNLAGHAAGTPWSRPRQLKHKPFLRANCPGASGEQSPRVFVSSAQVWAEAVLSSSLLLRPRLAQ